MSIFPEHQVRSLDLMYWELIFFSSGRSKKKPKSTSLLFLSFFLIFVHGFHNQTQYLIKLRNERGVVHILYACLKTVLKRSPTGSRADPENNNQQGSVIRTKLHPSSSRKAHSLPWSRSKPDDQPRPRIRSLALTVRWNSGCFDCWGHSSSWPLPTLRYLIVTLQAETCLQLSPEVWWHDWVALLP